MFCTSIPRASPPSGGMALSSAGEAAGTARGSIAQELTGRIRDMILRGKFVSGEHLREMALAELFSVSRTPIRAALAANEKDGLLEYSQNRGYVVRPFDIRDIADAYEMRAMLEGFACRKAAERGLELDAERNARRAINAVGALLESGDPLDDAAREAWRRHNTIFHRAIIEHAENSFLPAMLQLVNRIPSVFPPIFPTYDADALRVFNDQHTRILKCILDRQGTRAEVLMREHAYLACETFCASIRDRTKRDGTARPDDADEETIRMTLVHGAERG